MAVVLEALAAREGDALLLRWGSDANPKLWVIDGGPSGVYRGALAPRLRELRLERGLGEDEPLPLDLVVVSHVDGDHILGIIDLFDAMTEAGVRQGAPVPYEVRRAWHNSFDMLLDSEPLAGVRSSFEQSVDSLVAEIGDGLASAASIGQGRRLADLLNRFDRGQNAGFDGLVIAPRRLADVDGADVTIIGPGQAQLIKLAAEWDKQVVQPIALGDLAEAAAYVDDSVSNLSSIAMHVMVEGKTLLLTGDARGDHLLGGLAGARLLDGDGRCHVDVLKVPHHGSDRNLERAFFETVIANHYVISADGKHDNPSVDVLDWIVDTQGGRPYMIHLTYGDAMGAAAHLADVRQSHVYVVNRRDPAALSVSVTLS